jgi:Ca2+/H+ antiporter
VLVIGTVWNGRSSRLEGAVLVVAYAALVVGFLLAGNR